LTNGHSICEINNEGKMVDCRFIGEDIVWDGKFGCAGHMGESLSSLWSF
jgi:hypothetical protein